jgi:hypothetical protein
MSETLDNSAVEAKRPTFLTVLCVLTFIGSGWGAISALAFQDAGVSAYASYYYWVVLVLNLGTLFGALQMWKLKKTGLFIWTACEVIGVILMWVVVKGYLSSLMSGTAVSGTEMGAEMENALNNAGSTVVQGAMNMVLIIGSLFPAVFIILYWLNAKHLK